MNISKQIRSLLAAAGASLVLLNAAESLNEDGPTDVAIVDYH